MEDQRTLRYVGRDGDRGKEEGEKREGGPGRKRNDAK